MQVSDRFSSGPIEHDLRAYQTQATAAQSVDKVGSVAPTTPVHADSATISESAQRLARTHQAVQNSPDIRTDMVTRIKSEIQSGTYQVSPAAIAKQMVAHHLQTLAPQQPAAAPAPTPPAQ